jgi:repressor LexA
LVTRIQEKIVVFIRKYAQAHGYAPSVRDIMGHCAFKSPRAVSFHLEKLEKAGVLRRDRKARSILLSDSQSALTIPVLGAMDGGKTGEMALQPGWFAAGMRRGGFALRVRGDGMQEARIFDGDLAIVEPKAPKAGDIVVAVVNAETLVRRYIKQKDKYFLRAENPKRPEMIPSDDLKIQGVVVGIYRPILA